MKILINKNINMDITIESLNSSKEIKIINKTSKTIKEYEFFNADIYVSKNDDGSFIFLEEEKEKDDRVAIIYINTEYGFDCVEGKSPIFFDSVENERNDGKVDVKIFVFENDIEYSIIKEYFYRGVLDKKYYLLNKNGISSLNKEDVVKKKEKIKI